ncbi:MAG: cytochrome c oxidase assembly protein [Paracoccaceae bacterium]|nr:cytochrome c oxidase assembly protein [Paracoccaceae bacterium]|tara:strand:+ start:13149 stop:13730 length:582 start_codon:yes stop_codon:yes gene_type:complete
MELAKKNKKVFTLLSIVVVTMVSLAFASVPFYDWFCRVTGFAGTTLTASSGPNVVINKEIKVRFDGSVDRGLEWEFRPVQKEVKLKIGETALAFYEAYNPTDRPIMGTASYNVFPFSAGSFFTKIDCFCFEEQILAPGERVQMPVTFYIDPEIENDRDGKFIEQITLSYTFFEQEIVDEARLISQPLPNIKSD